MLELLRRLALEGAWDIHTLFDLDLLGIEPEQLQVELHPSLTGEYRYLAGKPLQCAPGQRPSRAALRLRYEQFQRKLRLIGKDDQVESSRVGSL